jgi:hypothetical protein
MSYKNIGNIHAVTGDLKQALIYYKKAAAIYHHSLPCEHLHVIRIGRNIRNVSTK